MEVYRRFGLEVWTVWTGGMGGVWRYGRFRLEVWEVWTGASGGSDWR